MAAQLLNDPREVLFHHLEIRRTAPETAGMEFPVGPARFPDADHLLRLVAVKLPPALASTGAADFGHVQTDTTLKSKKRVGCQIFQGPGLSGQHMVPFARRDLSSSCTALMRSVVRR
jgi:hypothetical protein